MFLNFSTLLLTYISMFLNNSMFFFISMFLNISKFLSCQQPFSFSCSEIWLRAASDTPGETDPFWPLSHSNNSPRPGCQQAESGGEAAQQPALHRQLQLAAPTATGCPSSTTTSQWSRLRPCSEC